MAGGNKVRQAGVSSRDEIFDLFKRCNTDQPAEADLIALRQYLAKTPGHRRSQNCLLQLAIDNRLEQIFKNAIKREYTRAKLDDMARQLQYDESPELEKLVIKNILLCWLNLYYIQSCCTNLDSDSHNMTMGLYWDRRLNNAQRRFLKAVDSLSKLRKVTVQIELRENRQESVGKTKTKRTVRISEER